MSEEEVRKIADGAAFIVKGYAFMNLFLCLKAGGTFWVYLL